MMIIIIMNTSKLQVTSNISPNERKSDRKVLPDAAVHDRAGGRARRAAGAL